MTDYFTGTLQECRDYIAKMNAMMGYPNPRTKTITYAKPVKHAKLDTGYLVILKEVWGPKLKRQMRIKDIDDNSTEEEKTTKRKSRETLEAEGAFATEEQIKVVSAD